MKKSNQLFYGQEITGSISSESATDVGAEKHLGVTYSVEEGTVAKGDVLNITVMVALNAETERESLSDDKNVIFDHVSAINNFEKTSSVKLKKNISITVQHHFFAESEADYKDLEFQLFKSPQGGKKVLQYFKSRKGHFFSKENGEKVGQTYLSNSDLEDSIFVVVARKSRKGMPDTKRK